MKKLFVFCLTLLSFMVSKAQDITGALVLQGQENWYTFQCRNDASIKYHAWVIAPGAGSFVNDDGTLDNCPSKLMGGDCSTVRIRWNTECGLDLPAYLQIFTTKSKTPNVVCNSGGSNPFLPGNIVENQYGNNFGRVTTASCPEPIQCKYSQRKINEGVIALNSNPRTTIQHQLLANLWAEGDDQLLMLISQGIIDNESIAQGICANLTDENGCGNLDISGFCEFQEITVPQCKYSQEDINNGIIALNSNPRTVIQHQLLANLWAEGDDQLLMLISQGIIDNESIAQGICANLTNENGCGNLDISGFCEFTTPVNIKPCEELITDCEAPSCNDIGAFQARINEGLAALSDITALNNARILSCLEGGVNGPKVCAIVDGDISRAVIAGLICESLTSIVNSNTNGCIDQVDISGFCNFVE